MAPPRLSGWRRSRRPLPQTRNPLPTAHGPGERVGSNAMPFQDVWPCQESTNKRLNTRGAGSVISIERTLRGQGAPSSEEFVTAVIRVHERLIARLKALAGSPSPADREAHEDAEIIRSYSALNG